MIIPLPSAPQLIPEHRSLAEDDADTEEEGHGDGDEPACAECDHLAAEQHGVNRKRAEGDERVQAKGLCHLPEHWRGVCRGIELRASRRRTGSADSLDLPHQQILAAATAESRALDKLGITGWASSHDVLQERYRPMTAAHCM